MKFNSRYSSCVVVIVSLLILTGCQSNHSLTESNYSAKPPNSKQSSIPQSTATQSVTQQSDIPATLVVPSTAVTGTISTRALETPVGDQCLMLYEIASGQRESVLAARWSSDGEQIFYLVAECCSDEHTEWRAYDIQTHSTVTTSEQLQTFDVDIWAKLKVPNPLENLSLRPELLGYISPSGQRVIFTTKNQSESNQSTSTDIWIADLGENGRRNKILEVSRGHIHQAVWLNNEARVIFDYGYEGGVRLYVADVEDSTVRPLTEMSDFKKGTEEHWSVSPDGITLAIIDFNLELWLIDLESGKTTKVDRFVRYPSWSSNGEVLYYWWGPSATNTSSLRGYDVMSQRTFTIATESSLIPEFEKLIGLNFAVSPSQDRVTFWDRGLWLLEFCDGVPR